MGTMKTLTEKVLDAFKKSTMATNKPIPTGIGIQEQIQNITIQGMPANTLVANSGTITTSSGAVSSGTIGSSTWGMIAPPTTTYTSYQTGFVSGSLRTIFNVPDDAEVITKTVFPFKEKTIFKCKHTNTYMVQNTWGYNLEKKKTEYDVTQQTIFLGDAMYNSTTGLSYVQPSQLLAVTIDYLKGKENPTEEEANSIKHMQYALAFLEKDILNKTKDNG